VHQHLGEVGAVRLVLRLREHQLHGADDALRILGHQQRTLAARHALGHVAPERERALLRGSGSMKLTEAPPSTQSLSTSAKPCSCASVTPWS
jgi:hypothetical protein